MEKAPVLMLIELEGRDEDGRVFDSSKGEIAKQLYGKEGPLLVIPGISPMVPGLAKALHSMAKGEQKSIKLQPEDAFGVRDPKLVKVLPAKWFREARLVPQVGMMIEADINGRRRRGIVKSVANGRVKVDFNHPLAGKAVIYDVKVVDVIEDDKEKVQRILDYFSIPANFELNEQEVVVKAREPLSDEQKLLLIQWIMASMPELKNVRFEEAKKPKAQAEVES